MKTLKESLFTQHIHNIGSDKTLKDYVEWLSECPIRKFTEVDWENASDIMNIKPYIDSIEFKGFIIKNLKSELENINVKETKYHVNIEFDCDKHHFINAINKSVWDKDPFI